VIWGSFRCIAAKSNSRLFTCRFDGEEGKRKGCRMKEERVIFTSQDLNIEGLISESRGRKGVVVTHPHPLYGGSMDNNVVESVARVYGEKGYTTLRFNFRGVGRSQGTYDNGTGEQEDVRAAVAYLAQLGTTFIDLAGYSFGAWINAQCIERLTHVRGMIMVSPPVNFLDFSFLRACPKIRLVIAGAEDDIAPPGMIEEVLPAWSPDAAFRIIKGADHFYRGKTHEIETTIGGWIDLKG
jgi:alpha/beta superfamily hydrolase